jgi:CotH kinase protein
MRLLASAGTFTRVIATSLIALAAALAAAPSGHLPVVRIDAARPISDEPKVAARLRMPGYAGRIGLELRGQSSQMFPKRSYAVELRTAGGRDRKVPLLGMPADGDWVLYAAYNDKTLIRNAIAYETARGMGRWAAETRFVELVVDGRYDGVYVLMERPELGEARIDVPSRGITGAYLLEFTFPYQAGRKGAHFRTPIRRRPIVYEDPERSDLTAREARYVRGAVGRVERTLYRGRRGAWRTVLDPGAAVDYVLLQELFRNVDAFHGSTYLTKPAGGRLVLGPVWDFDLSTGNSTYGLSRRTRGWWTARRDWAAPLHRDPTFRAALRARWRALRAGGLRERVLSAVARSAAQVRRAARGNFARWPVLHRRVWPNPAARGSFDAEVRFLRAWLARRIAWLDRATRPNP